MVKSSSWKDRELSFMPLRLIWPLDRFPVWMPSRLLGRQGLGQAGGTGLGSVVIGVAFRALRSPRG